MAAQPEIVSESSIKGISVRAIIVLVLIFVFSISVFFKINNEALNSVVMATIGWYFGQKGNGNGNSNGSGNGNGSYPPLPPLPSNIPQPVPTVTTSCINAINGTCPPNIEITGGNKQSPPV